MIVREIALCLKMNISSQARASSPTGVDRAPRRRAAKINPADIQRVVDGTAEQVRKDFENFLSRFVD